MIRRHAVHIASRRAHPAEEIPSAYHQPNLHTRPRHFRDFGCQPVEAFLVNAKSASAGQNFTAQLQKGDPLRVALFFGPFLSPWPLPQPTIS